MLYVVMGVAVVGVVILLGGVVLSRRADKAFLEERLGIADERAADAETSIADAVRSTPVADALNRVLARRGVGADLATQLARADMKITVGEFMVATVVLVVAATGIFYVLTRDILITALACLAAFFGPRIYISVARGRRLKAFTNQLGDTIQLMVNGIRAGYSILQAMEAVSREMGPPIADEFGRVVQEVQLGLTMEHALDNMLRRVPSDDLDMMITAVNVQREVGGNLAEVLDSIAYTIRERVRIKGELMAMTGQSRISGYMIAAIPVLLSILLYVINPEYMKQLLDHTCGYIMLGCAGIGMLAGFAVINKVMQIDV